MANAWMKAASAISDLTIVGLVDLNPQAACELAQTFHLADVHIGTSLQAAIDATRPDIVFDVTIPAAHHEVVTTALSAGCHVLGEKPMATSMEQARAMVATAKETGKLYAVTQNYRYQEAIQRVKQALDAGGIGTIHSIHADFFVGARFGGFRAQMDHVLIVDMAIHPFDMARYLSGSKPLSVYCHEVNPPGSWYRHGANASAIFEMSNDVTFNFRGSWCAEGFGTGFNSHWRIVGTEGTLLWQGDRVAIERSRDEAAFIRPCDTSEIPPLEWSSTQQGHHGLMRDFITALRSGQQPMTHCEDNLHSIAMVLHAVQSAETGQRVGFNCGPWSLTDSPASLQKLTWKWLAPRLEALNVHWLEKTAGLRDKRLNDVKRGKSTLSEEELERIRKALLHLNPDG